MINIYLPDDLGFFEWGVDGVTIEVTGEVGLEPSPGPEKNSIVISIYRYNTWYMYMYVCNIYIYVIYIYIHICTCIYYIHTCTCMYVMIVIYMYLPIAFKNLTRSLHKSHWLLSNAASNRQVAN